MGVSFTQFGSKKTYHSQISPFSLSCKYHMYLFPAVAPVFGGSIRNLVLPHSRTRQTSYKDGPITKLIIINVCIQDWKYVCVPTTD